MTYRVEELRGVELIVDDQTVALAYRGEGRRSLDYLPGAEKMVRLRFVFDDPAWPDFCLDLWLPQDADRRGALTPAEAAQEGSRWVGRIEALFHRPIAPPPAPNPASGPEFAPLRE